ncbi:Enoyl-CoA hydratase/isomerase family protein [Candidatus Phaeomarinobacter ectocarpi]|uniref:Enoyl-CoA hydratase/isomerase family protein n=1 Tax=Candidatus Phaeomarinibacter ectocarpi TaxID=1458461 RepID=X5M8P2_9HYPH|nr:enoyl-CoA hydratase-related protein [Candidatus Phaeomarinobacter ectocarpi]CDO59703.1 Enoyl-CoA hydratase/isomerase family protein [Candidatus Phaeomarinobacter ectocarpi]
MSVTLDMNGDVAVITMNDGKANAVNPALLEGLEAAMDKAEADAKAVVLTGKPGLFSAGFDHQADEWCQPSKKLIALVNRGGAFALRTVWQQAARLVAACTGHCHQPWVCFCWRAAIRVLARRASLPLAPMKRSTA